jgi:acyl carrier protein
MDRAAFYQETIALLGRLNTLPGEQQAQIDVAEEDNLFDEGYLTSFSVAQVMAFIEEMTATAIDPARYGIESFSSLSKLYDVFHQQRSGALAG